MLCEKCGKEIHDSSAFCEFCGAPVSREVSPHPSEDLAPKAPVQKPENIVTGIVGAILGAALGALSIVILGQLGYVASLSGLILAVCTLKGYELLGGQLSGKGIAISILLILVTPYLADRINWALVIMDEFDVSFAISFAAVHDVIESAELVGAYLKDLLMLYLFAALGAGSSIHQAIKTKKAAKT